MIVSPFNHVSSFIIVKFKILVEEFKSNIIGILNLLVLDPCLGPCYMVPFIHLFNYCVLNFDANQL